MSNSIDGMKYTEEELKRLKVRSEDLMERMNDMGFSDIINETANVLADSMLATIDGLFMSFGVNNVPEGDRLVNAVVNKVIDGIKDREKNIEMYYGSKDSDDIFNVQ